MLCLSLKTQLHSVARVFSLSVKKHLTVGCLKGIYFSRNLRNVSSCVSFFDYAGLSNFH